MRLNENPISIDPSDAQVVFKETADLYVFNYRSTVSLSFFVELNETPFDRFTVSFTLELQSKVGGEHLLRYNLHINESDEGSNLSFKKTVDCLHEFNLDYSKNKVALIAEKKNDRQGNLIYEYAPKIQYDIGFYREPESLLITLFMPILILIFLAYLVFFSPGSLNDKLGNLATIILAILAY